jgi:hypothetical protein
MIDLAFLDSAWVKFGLVCAAFLMIRRMQAVNSVFPSVVVPSSHQDEPQPQRRPI